VAIKKTITIALKLGDLHHLCQSLEFPFGEETVTNSYLEKKQKKFIGPKPLQ
jgi:hypothetical protein